MLDTSRIFNFQICKQKRKKTMTDFCILNQILKRVLEFHANYTYNYFF